MDPSDSPDGPVCPSRATGWLTPPPPGVSRVASDPLHADMPSPLPRWDHSWDRVAPRGAVTAAFPTHLLGRLPHHCFRGLLGVHSRYGLPARGVPWGPFASKASAGSLPPLPLRLLPAGATVAGWDSDPLRISAFARRTNAYHSCVSPPAHAQNGDFSSGVRAASGDSSRSAAKPAPVNRSQPCQLWCRRTTENIPGNLIRQEAEFPYWFRRTEGTRLRREVRRVAHECKNDMVDPRATREG